MPAVPKILDVAGGQRIIEIFSHRNAHQTGGADGDVAKTGKVEVEVEVIKNHRHRQVDPRMKVVIPQEVTITQLIAEDAQKLVFDGADQQSQTGPGDGNAHGRPGKRPCIFTVGADGADQHGRDKKAKAEVFSETGRTHDAVANLHHQVTAAKGQEGNPH